MIMNDVFTLSTIPNTERGREREREKLKQWNSVNTLTQQPSVNTAL